MDVWMRLSTYWHDVKRVRIRRYSGLHFSRIFPHSDWIRRDTEYFSVFSPNAGKSGKNADQNNSEYGLFLRSVILDFISTRFSIAGSNVSKQFLSDGSSLRTLSMHVDIPGHWTLWKLIILQYCWSQSSQNSTNKFLRLDE